MRVHIVLASLLLLHLGGAPALPSAEAVDGPGHPFRDSLIENLAGHWKIMRAVRGQQVENSLDAEWVLAHQFLQLHMRDVANPPTYEALVLIGYSYADQRYVAHWCDTYGGRFSAIGYGKRNGEQIEFAFQYPEGPFYNTFIWEPARQGWVFRMENSSSDGKRSLFAVDTFSRR
jgi:hypothetical protein